MRKKQPAAKIAKAARATGAVRATPPIEDDERYREQVDDFITRNRDALNESISGSRREVSAGKSSKKSISDIIAEGRKRNA